MTNDNSERGEFYHRDAIIYNEGLQKEAERLAELVEDPEVKKWCRHVAKQHKFHTRQHRRKLEDLTKTTEEEKTVTESTPEVPEQTTPETAAESSYDESKEAPATNAVFSNAPDQAGDDQPTETSEPTSEPAAAERVDAGGPDPAQAAQPVSEAPGVPEPDEDGYTPYVEPSNEAAVGTNDEAEQN